jgi:hypothetical protein
VFSNSVMEPALSQSALAGRQIPRTSRPSPGIDRLALWFRTARPCGWGPRDFAYQEDAAANVHLTARGSDVGIDFNPSRMVHSGSTELATLDEALEVSREVWETTCNHVEPAVDFEEARVTRLDLSRDFHGALDPAMLIKGMSLIHRPHGGDPVVRYDGRTHQAKSLSVGSKTRRVIVYDKASQSGRAAAKTLRWELQARSTLLRKFDIKSAGDLTPDRVQRLFETQWRWSQMETPVTSTSELFDFIIRSGVPERQRAGITWSILQVQHGVKVSDYNQRQLAKFVREHGLAIELGVPLTEVGPTITERLDWESGKVVTTMGSGA